MRSFRGNGRDIIRALQQHLGRCSRDCNVLYATLGAGFWGLLSIAVLGATGVAALLP